MTGTDPGIVRLAGSATDLAVLAERAARHDPAAPVRVLATGPTLAAFVTTPFDTLGMRASRLASDATLDVVVEAVGLAARARSAVDGRLVLPPRLPDIAWATPLPPRHGWSEVARVSTVELAERVAADTEEFKARAAHVDAGRGANAALEAIATDVWARPMRADCPARLAHTADYLGFLAPGGDGVLRSAGAWRRLDTGVGVALTRVNDPLGLFVS